MKICRQLPREEQLSVGLYKYCAVFDVYVFFCKIVNWVGRIMYRTWVLQDNISSCKDQSAVENFKYFTWPNYDPKWNLSTHNSHICVHEPSVPSVPWIGKRYKVDLYFASVWRDLSCFIWEPQKGHYAHRFSKAFKSFTESITLPDCGTTSQLNALYCLSRPTDVGLLLPVKLYFNKKSATFGFA